MGSSSSSGSASMMADRATAAIARGGKAEGGGGGAKRSLYRMHRELGRMYRESEFAGTYKEWLRSIGYRPGRRVVHCRREKEARGVGAAA